MCGGGEEGETRTLRIVLSTRDKYGGSGIYSQAKTPASLAIFYQFFHMYDITKM